MPNSILKFLKRWNELGLVFLSLLLWPLIGPALRLIDPTAAPLDAGVLHPIYVTTLAFGVLHFFVWVGLKLNFAGVFEFFQREFICHFEKLKPCQKLYFSLSVFALYLLSVVLTFAAVAGML